MVWHLQESPKKLLAIDFSTLAVWLPSVTENAMPLLKRIKASRAEILTLRAGGGLACRYSVFADGDDHLLRIEITRAGREVSFGSVILCCKSGCLYRTYALDTTEGKRWERQFFRSFDDATRYLIFASRLDCEAEAGVKAGDMPLGLAMPLKTVAAQAA